MNNLFDNVRIISSTSIYSSSTLDHSFNAQQVNCFLIFRYFKIFHTLRLQFKYYSIGLRQN